MSQNASRESSDPAGGVVGAGPAGAPAGEFPDDGRRGATGVASSRTGGDAPPGGAAGAPAQPPSGAGAAPRRGAGAGAAWSFVGTAAAQALRFVRNIALGYLLEKEAFGLMKLVDSVLLGLRMLSDVGITASIVQRKEADDPRFLDTAWTLQVLRGSGLWIVALLVAWPIGAFYGDVRLWHLLPVVGGTIVLDSFASTSLGSLRRGMHVRALTMLEVAAQACALIVTVTWALLSPTVWALVAGAVAHSLLRLAVSHTLLATRRVRFAWHRPSVTSVMSFGSWTLFNTPLNFLANQADRFVLPKLVAMGTFGVYSVALTIAEIPFLLLSQLSGSVIFPGLARVRNEGRDLWEAFARARRSTYALGGLLVSGVIATGPLAIVVLWDDKFHGAAPLVLPLAAGQWVRVLYVPSSNVLFAMGELHWLVKANALRLVAYGLIPLGFHLGGLPGALWAFAGSETIGWATYLVGLRREGRRSLLGDLGHTLRVAAIAGAGLLAAHGLQLAGAPRWLSLLAAGATVTLLWLPVLLPMLRQLRGGR